MVLKLANSLTMVGSSKVHSYIAREGPGYNCVHREFASSLNENYGSAASRQKERAQDNWSVSFVLAHMSLGPVRVGFCGFGWSGSIIDGAFGFTSDPLVVRGGVLSLVYSGYSSQRPSRRFWPDQSCMFQAGRTFFVTRRSFSSAEVENDGILQGANTRSSRKLGVIDDAAVMKTPALRHEQKEGIVNEIRFE